MKKILLLLFSVLTYLFCLAQKDAARWKAAIGPRRIFVENKGQFDQLTMDAGGKIIFGTDNGSSSILFTNSGLLYQTANYGPEKEDESEQANNSPAALAQIKEYREKEREKKNKNKVELPVGLSIVKMQWVGANANVQIVGEKKTADYFNYHLANSSVSHALAYQKITYKNLYNNIDVVYTFHEGRGIEYSLILHPGADISQVKMRYSGADKMSISANGDIHAATMFGDIIDRVPETYSYAGYNTISASNLASGKIISSFNLNGNDVSFKLEDYDHAQTIIIDPWTTTPTLPRSNRAFYIKTDSTGNAYVYGGDTPFTLEKYNTSGTLQWTYSTSWDTSSDWFGCLIVDRSGNSYITNGTGATLAKISPAGSQVWSNNTTSGFGEEYWSMDFNCDQSQLVIGGMKNLTGWIFNMNLTNGAVISAKQVAKTYNDTTWIPIIHIPLVTAFPNEIRTLCFSPNGNYYFMTPDTLGSISTALGFSYEIPSKFILPYYLPYSEGGTGQGQNSIRATVNYIYTTDGQTLQQRDIGTGAIIDSVRIPGGTYQMNSGLAIDTCGNVYVGSQSSVVKYSANLAYISTSNTPSAVFDVSIGANGDVMACGQGFAVALAMGACPQVKPICDISLNASLAQTNPLCSGLCTGSATASTTNGTGPYIYAWSNGGTSQTISNLCAATYTVTVTDQSNNSTATATTIISQPSAITASATPTAATCGNATGSETASITSGTGTFTYAWSNGGSGQTISNIAAGSYTVTATNTSGCTATASATVTSTGSITLSHTATATTCGNNNGQASVSVTAGTGPFTYAWSNGGTAAAISSLTAGNYTVTVSGGGCSATGSASVATSTVLTLSAPVVDSSGCGQANGSASISVASGSGPYTYAWSNGSTATGIVDVAAGTYTVTVSGSGCTATGSAVIGSSSGITLTVFGGRAGCVSSGTASVTVTSGTGPFTYLWSNGETTADINSLAAGNYTVTVTSQTSCTAMDTATVISTGSGVSLTSASAPAGCSTNTGSASVATTSGNPPFTYAWSNGATTDTISNIAGGNYTVTVTSHDGCTATVSVSVSASGTLTVNVSSTGSTCGGSSGSASVIPVGTGPFTYNWSTGGSADSITDVASGTYTVTVQGTGSCSATANATVSSSGGTVNLQTTQNTICQGDTAQICAPAGFHSYAWSNGQTSQCINATATGNYYVTVSDNGTCTAVSNHVGITVNTPVAVTITQHGDTLVASTATSYQWYVGNTLIAGATSSVYIATQSGTYSVNGTGGNGCTSTSNSEVVKVVLGVTQISADENIKVYPNPLSSGNWHIEVSDEWIGSACNVIDATGRVIYRTQLKSSKSEIELNVAQGIYLLRINSGQRNYTIKLIKL